MDEKLRRIIEESSFKQIPGRYYYVKARTRPNGSHFAVVEDGNEVTVITDRVNEIDVAGQNQTPYTLFALNISVPFYAVGFLAAVSSAIATKGMNILIVSTYSKDYILVAFDKTEIARSVLVELGFKEL